MRDVAERCYRSSRTALFIAREIPLPPYRMTCVWYAVADPAVRNIVLQVHPDAQPYQERSGARRGESEVLIVGTRYLLDGRFRHNSRIRTVVYISTLDARHIEMAAEMFHKGAAVATSAPELAAASAIDRPGSHCRVLLNGLRVRRPSELVSRLADLMIREPEALARSARPRQTARHESLGAVSRMCALRHDASIGCVRVWPGSVAR